MRGGAGKQYQTSLKRGGNIISYIFDRFPDKYKIVDILIDKDHIWHLGGLPISPSDLSPRVDIVWNTTHPSFSNILNSLNIPNISSSSFSSSLVNSQEMLRKHMVQIGISIPRSIVLPIYQKDFSGPPEKYAIKKAREVFGKFSSPWVVRSFMPGEDKTEMNVHLAQTFEELVDAISEGVVRETSILVEEFIAGKVVSIHCVPHFRGEELYIFPTVEVFGNFSQEDKKMLTILAKDLYHHLGAKHYLKSNLLLDKRGKVYLLDFEFTPNLKSYSHFSQACESASAKMHDVVEHILEQAL